MISKRICIDQIYLDKYTNINRALTSVKCNVAIEFDYSRKIIYVIETIKKKDVITEILLDEYRNFYTLPYKNIKNIECNSTLYSTPYNIIIKHDCRNPKHDIIIPCNNYIEVQNIYKTITSALVNNSLRRSTK